MIEIRHLRKEYDNVTPLKDVNADIHDGDIISIIGPSGTGKSTFIRCLNMLEKPTSGSIRIDGTDLLDPVQPLEPIRKKMGMVFQSFNLFGHRTVLENVMMGPMDLLGMPRQEAYDQAMRLLEMVGMEEKAMSYPSELSGGQKQRAAIARTLSMDPKIILFDEPTSALDPTMVGEVQAVIAKLAEMGRTMMIVTHEMRFAREIANRVFYMDDGGIYEEGTPEQIFDEPRKERTRRFIRQLKVYEAELGPDREDCFRIQRELEQYAGKNAFVPRLKYRMESVFEEMTQQLLTPVWPDSQERIRVQLEYESRSRSLEMCFIYPGESFDPFKAEVSLSLAMIRSFTSKQSHYYNEISRENRAVLEMSSV